LPEGKEGLLIGGGSGHEPLFPCFVGDNLADAAACGHVFAAPSPDVILAATRAAHRGQGVLYLYGNYAGDNLNFDMAAELAAEEGIATRTVRVWDDVAAAPPARRQERRGIAGDLLVLKVAGAAASVLPDLESVYRVTALARDQTCSLGIAVAAGSIPETGEPTFELGDDEIEVGMGLHGEPGVRREKLPAADPLVENMVQRLVADSPYKSGDEVCLLVNDLGSTTWMELLIATRKAHQVLKQDGIRIYDTVVGSYCTCQEMAGFSLSLLRLNPELKRYYDMPARSLAFNRGQWDE
jgi:dihydroxyacetone kinase-like protein